MKLIDPSIEYWPQVPTFMGAWDIIAKAARVCYQSEARKDESSFDFVKRVILKSALIKGDLNGLSHCKFNIEKLHGGVLEHGTIYLAIPIEQVLFSDAVASILSFYRQNPYSQVVDPSSHDIKFYYVTTNMRVILEHDRWNDLKYMCDPSKHKRRYTFSVITDIGVTREFNRHRASMSICEESTRYCDYSKKKKFGGELTFIRPHWLKDKEELGDFMPFCMCAETSYKRLREVGWKPEEARQILPLGLKTQAVYTAFYDDWLHFIRLRADNVSGKAHPNINYIANMIKDKLNEITQ